MLTSYLCHSVVLLPAPGGPPRPGRPGVGGLELGAREGGALVLVLELPGEEGVVDVLDGDGGEDVGDQGRLGRRRSGRHSVFGGKGTLGGMYRVTIQLVQNFLLTLI